MESQKQTYIFRLIDEKAMIELKESTTLSLFRPMDHFASEVKGLSILSDFRKMQSLFDEDVNKVRPSKSNLNKTRTMMNDYYESLADDVKEKYNYDYDIDDDLAIITTFFCTTYCSYFTWDNLDDPVIRKQYRINNCKIASEKIAYIKVPIEENGLNNKWWISNDSYIFSLDSNQCNTGLSRELRSLLWILDEEYNPPEKLKNPFVFFNDSERKAYSFFKHLNEK